MAETRTVTVTLEVGQVYEIKVQADGISLTKLPAPSESRLEQIAKLYDLPPEVLSARVGHAPREPA